MKFAERIFNGIPIVTGLFNIRKNFSISKTDIFLTGIKTIFFFFFFPFKFPQMHFIFDCMYVQWSGLNIFSEIIVDFNYFLLN